jgi:hypothetical protein
MHIWIIKEKWKKNLNLSISMIIHLHWDPWLVLCSRVTYVPLMINSTVPLLFSRSFYPTETRESGLITIFPTVGSSLQRKPHWDSQSFFSFSPFPFIVPYHPEKVSSVLLWESEPEMDSVQENL